MHELLALALTVGIFGLLLVIISKRWRASRGWISGKTVALDDVTLFSERLQLVGRPDRIVRAGEYLIPEEWKSAKRVSHGHRLQVIAYCLLIEEQFGKRPTHGVVVNDGSRVVVENTEELRSEVLAIAAQIRERHRTLGEDIRVWQPFAKCRACGHRGNCRQASRDWQADERLRSLKLIGRLRERRSRAILRAVAKFNLSAAVSASLIGWSCLWPLGWLCSWPFWWIGSAIAFFLATSFLLAWTFFREESLERDQ